MPPKKSATTAKQSKAKNASAQAQRPTEDVAARASSKTNGTRDGEATSKKRKINSNDSVPQKMRRSGRSSSKSQPPSQELLLNFLLSEEAEELIRPDDETRDIKERGNIRTYSSAVLCPFEELMCAIILSRPISHRLGLRTIRTVLNTPYNFTSAKAVQDAGSEKQHQALWDARTQHKDKTAQQLGNLADVVLEKFTSTKDKEGKRLDKISVDSNGDMDKAHEMLKDSIKGLGKTGLEIFFRRVQWLWDDIFPFIDSRTVDSLRKFDLPYEAEQLEKLFDDNWKKLKVGQLAGDNEAQKKRRAFVLILERVIGADLEGQIESAVSAATA